MIYIKQYNSLFDSPRVYRPNYDEYADTTQWRKDTKAYQIWLSSKIEVMGDHTWQDLQEVREGVDYTIEKQHTYWNEVRAKNVTVPAYAILITPKPDDLVPGVREEDFVWRREKPKFTKDCLLLVATVCGNAEPDYNLYQIKASDGYDEQDKPAWYWGVFTCNGEEWGGLGRLRSQLLHDHAIN